MSELECFWREIFTTPSAEDTRTPTSTGPTQLGMVAPVTRDEVLTALKGMKDGAPESVWFLQQLIQQHKSELSPLNIAFVDVERVFDRVSHQSFSKEGSSSNSQSTTFE